MYLFEGKKGKITIYSFDLLKGKAREFRESEMKRIKGDKVFMATEHVEKGAKPIFNKDIKSKAWYNKKDLKGVTLTPYGEEQEKYVLEEFNKGNLTNPNDPSKLLQVTNDNYHRNYYLIGYSKAPHTESVIHQAFISYSIVRMPKTLYLLSAIEQGQFELTIGSDINRQLKLFTFNEIDKVDEYSVRIAAQFGLTGISDFEICKRLRNDGQFVRRIKGSN